MNTQCGSCAIEERAAVGYLLSLHLRPIESLVLQVTESRGFCSSHTRWFLRTTPNPRMPVLVYRYVVISILRSRQKRWRLPQASCPACVAGEQAAQRAIDRRSTPNDPLCARHGSDDRAIGSVYLDNDAPVRAHLRNIQAIAIDECDLCRVRAEAEAHSLAASARNVEPATMCDAHLSDLAFIDSKAALQPTRRRSGVADCTVCRAGRQTEHLLLPDAGALCLAHTERREGRWKRHRAMDLRLEILRWELDELSRKLAWNGRAEEVGVERDVWLRAPLLLDGQVALGRGSVALAQALGCESLTHAAGRVLGGDGARLEPP